MKSIQCEFAHRLGAPSHAWRQCDQASVVIIEEVAGKRREAGLCRMHAIGFVTAPDSVTLMPRRGLGGHGRGE